jgi:hypothetical protein
LGGYKRALRSTWGQRSEGDVAGIRVVIEAIKAIIHSYVT